MQNETVTITAKWDACSADVACTKIEILRKRNRCIEFASSKPIQSSIVINFVFLPAGSAAGSSAGTAFTHGPILRFFAPQGRHVALIKVKFGREERTVGLLLPAKFHFDRLRGGVQGPQNWKKSNFTNIIAPKGQVPCTIFTKFTCTCTSSVSIILLNLADLFR